MRWSLAPMSRCLAYAGAFVALAWQGNGRCQTAFPALALACQILWVASLFARPG